MGKIESVKGIAVIGAGSWGTAIARLIAHDNPQVNFKIWAYEKSVVNSINKTKENKLYLSGYSIPDNIAATGSIREALHDADIVIIAVPSKAIIEITQKIAKYLKEPAHIGFLSKGFCKINHKTYTISQTISHFIPKVKDRIAAICGPSHAEEVLKNYHTCLSIGSKSKVTRKIFSLLLTNDFLQCRETEDILGVEIGGTLKNPAAIAAGMISALPKCGDNLSGALISEALKEMIRLSRIFKAMDDTIIDISGLGDLVATALSEHSRNRRFGKDIALQMIKNKRPLDFIDKLILKFRPEDVIEKMSKKLNYLAEGAYAIEPLMELAEEHSIAIPVYRSLYEVLLNKKDPTLLIETIKNPEKYESIYSATKIQITDRKKGLENVKGTIYHKIIVERTFQKLINENDNDNYTRNSTELILANLNGYMHGIENDPRTAIKRTEYKIINGITPDNFNKSINSLIRIYVNSIIDHYNPFFNWLYTKMVKYNRMLNILFKKAGKVNIMGNVEHIRNIDKTINIVYVPTYKSYQDFIILTHLINKMDLPFPRFFINSSVLSGRREKYFAKLSGGFIVDQKRMMNVVYKESLCEYVSTMIEHGIPMLYFPQQIPGNGSKDIILPSDFFEMVMEALFTYTVEIALVPIEINYGNGSSGPEDRISFKDYFKNDITVHFSDPLYLSDYTVHQESVKKISEAVKKVWNNDSVNNVYGIRLRQDEMLS